MRRKRLAIAVAAAGIILLAFCFSLPLVEIRVGPPLSTKNLSSAKQFALAAKFYAADHDGMYPTYLVELVPDYLATPNDIQDMLYSEMGLRKRFEPKYDWLYFAAGHDQKHLPHIIIASPQAVATGGANKRIVIYDDLSTVVIPEEQYQRELRQMIETVKKTSTAKFPTDPTANSTPNP